mgnify:CR=1 FL=1
MPIEDADYFIRLLPFPVRVPAFVHLNSDGTYVIFLNSNLDFSHRLDGWEHELWHILHDDLYGDKAIEDIEPFLA